MLNDKPVIGISALLYEASRDYRITHSYAEVVTAVGGIPVLLPAALPPEDVEALQPVQTGQQRVSVLRRHG